MKGVFLNIGYIDALLKSVLFSVRHPSLSHSQVSHILEFALIFQINANTEPEGHVQTLINALDCVNSFLVFYCIGLLETTPDVKQVTRICLRFYIPFNKFTYSNICFFVHFVTDRTNNEHCHWLSAGVVFDHGKKTNYPQE